MNIFLGHLVSIVLLSKMVFTNAQFELQAFHAKKLYLILQFQSLKIH